jgi:hypothetical protein
MEEKEENHSSYYVKLKGDKEGTGWKPRQILCHGLQSGSSGNNMELI